MVKSKEDVIKDFKNTVNLTADELEEWLKGPGSHKSGWSKNDGSGESVGHKSCRLAPAPTFVFANYPIRGRKIVEIWRKNPKKKASDYDEEDIAHMRMVAAYNKRHLAQVEKAKQDTNSNSYLSLKNWGHDAQKS